MSIQVKICCISSPSEAELAISAGADILGLVGPMPTGPGVLSALEIDELATRFRDRAVLFLLTSELEPARIRDQVIRSGVHSIQLVRYLDPSTRKELRQMLPETKLVQVVHVEDESAVEIAASAAQYSDLLLLDSGKPKQQQLGGTGKTHNWDISAEIVRMAEIPVFLAGGLNPGNVAAAITKVNPYGVDICSGIRAEKRLDPQKVDSFFTMLKPFL